MCSVLTMWMVSAPVNQWIKHLLLLVLKWTLPTNPLGENLACLFIDIEHNCYVVMLLVSSAAPGPMWASFPLSAAKEERLAKGKEKKEGSAKWSQGTGNRICPLPQRTPWTYAGQIPRLTFPGNHQETWSRVDTISPEWQTGVWCIFLIVYSAYI